MFRPIKKFTCACLHLHPVIMTYSKSSAQSTTCENSVFRPTKKFHMRLSTSTQGVVGHSKSSAKKDIFPVSLWKSFAHQDVCTLCICYNNVLRGDDFLTACSIFSSLKTGPVCCEVYSTSFVYFYSTGANMLQYITKIMKETHKVFL